MNCAILLAAALIAAEPHPDPLRAVMLEDYARFPVEDAKYIRYIRWDSVEIEPEKCEAIQAFWLPHLSRERVLQHQVPVKVADGLYRIDLRGLGWSLEAWYRLSDEYPYRYPPAPNTLHVRGDWLVRVTSNADESTLYYDLLYGVDKAPKDRDEFFKVWDAEVEKDPQAYIIQEGKSGVSHSERLMIVYRDGSSETFDSKDAVGDQSPLETIGGKLRFDAQELITPIYKVDIRTGERSYAQAYLLTDGQRKRVDKADTEVVFDHTSKTGVVVTPGGCVRCHTTGLLKPAHNFVRELISDGSEFYFKQKQLSIDVEAKYLGLLTKRLTRADEDFSAMVAGYTDLSTEECIAEYSAMLKSYDAGVTLEQAARELHCEPQELQNAVAWYFEVHGPQPKGANLAILAQGARSIPRRSWELYVFNLASKAMLAWRER